MLVPSVAPASRLFPAPAGPFDTEVALTVAGNLATEEQPGLVYVAAECSPSHPRTALVRRSIAPGAASDALALALIDRLRWRSPGPSVPSQRLVMVEDLTLASALEPVLADAGLRRSSVTFWACPAAALAQGARPILEPLIGDEAWRAWASVEREILAEALAPAELNEAQLDRSVQFKRRQQRESPPVRRFVAMRSGAPTAMIGYAPFGACDLGVGAPGVLVRLRDVAVRRAERRRGLGEALLRAVAARAIEDCGARQVLIGGVSQGPAASLYQKLGARPVGACVMFAGVIA